MALPNSTLSAPAVQVQGVSRSFGAVHALQQVDLTARAGEVTALVGPNGAGKTTLLLILATLLAPNTGTVHLAGVDVAEHPLAARAAIGWSPDVFGTYDSLTAREYLAVFHAAYRLPRAERAARVNEVLELSGTNDLADRVLATLSRGQKQRVGLARALVHRPSVLLLDEPAAGLDPRARVELRDLLRRLAREGAAVIVSSHVLADLEGTADRAVFVDHGTVVGEHALDALPTSQVARGWRVRSLDPQRLSSALLELAIPVREEAAGTLEVQLDSDLAAAKLLAHLVGAGVPVVAFAPAAGDLEAAFLSITDATPRAVGGAQ